MKIGIEASAVFRRNKTGVGYYSHDLMAALIKELPTDLFLLSYIKFFTKQPERLAGDLPNVQYRRFNLIPGRAYNALDHLGIAPPFDILTHFKADVVIFPNFFRWPLWLCRRSIIVIHDLAYLETPQHLVPRHRRYLERRVPQSARRASHIVAVSDYTKQRLVRQYDIDPDKITVVVPAVNHDQFQPTDAAEVARVRDKYKISGDYIMFGCTTVEPRKNVVSLLRAYLLLPQELRDKYQLVLAGGKGWLDDEINQVAATLPSDRLVRTGYVADADKPGIYTGATLMILPSHYEGWGMQVSEAMACGTPVLSARNSSLTEVGGTAAAYVDDPTPEALATSIVDILNSPEQRQSMRAAGVTQAEQFSWENSARVFATVLERFRRS